MGFLLAVLTAFARCFTELGIAMMVGGNIKARTRTLVTATALETGKGEFGRGLAMGIILLAIALDDIANEWGDAEIAKNHQVVQTARRAVILAKETLSFAPETFIELEFKGKKYQRALNRELFEKLIAPIVERTLAPCRAALKDAGLTAEQVDEVVLVGGSTRIPLVRQAVEALF